MSSDLREKKYYMLLLCDGEMHALLSPGNNIASEEQAWRTDRGMELIKKAGETLHADSRLLTLPVAPQ